MLALDRQKDCCPAPLGYGDTSWYWGTLQGSLSSCALDSPWYGDSPPGPQPGGVPGSIWLGGFPGRAGVPAVCPLAPARLSGSPAGPCLPVIWCNPNNYSWARSTTPCLLSPPCAQHPMRSISLLSEPAVAPLYPSSPSAWRTVTALPLLWVPLHLHSR